MLTPLHDHELQQVNPMSVYQAFAGRWKCDNCNAENDETSFPFHCRLCSFDLCYSCAHLHLQQNNLAHQHPLYYMETSRLLNQNRNGIWRCAVCKNTSDALRQTFSHHCPTCGDFDICRNCFEPKLHPVHLHELKLVDTSLIYPQTGGNWVCDICRNSNRPYEKFSHHCSECEFDVCRDCYKPHTTHLHDHPLYRADSHYVYAQFNGGWRCDNCGSVHNNPTDDKPWHCQFCEYDLCHSCMGSVIEAPLEILARGPLAIKAYIKALTEGKACIKRVPVMFIGQERAGKTSLKKSLKGEPFNEREEITEGIELDPSYFKVSTQIWEIGEKSKETNFETSFSFEHHAAAQLIFESLMEGKLNSDLPESTVDSKLPEVKSTSSSGPSVADSNRGLGISENQPNLIDPGDFVTNKTTLPDNFEGGNDTPLSEANLPETNAPEQKLPEENLPEPIAALVEKKLQSGEKVNDEDVVYTVLWDFGGQSVYYATHPIFLTEKAIYVLVCDLSRDPHETANPPVRKGLYENNVDISCSNTNLDYLDFWMSSVYSLVNPDATCHETSVHVSETLPRRLPPVFLVCTHADKLYCCSNARDLALKTYGFLRTKIYREHLFKDVFVVDNTKSGSEHECPEVRRLREKVLAVAKELPQVKEAIPLKWLKFEKALQIRKDNDKWIPLNKAKQIASIECSIDDEEEFSTLLNFLHDQRILIHFSGSPELETMVILDPQWLIEVLKKIITVKRYDHSEDKVAVLWLKLEKTGILDEKLIDHVWEPLFSNQETRKSLIAIMERLSLICSWPSSDSSKQYLVPSMLMSPPTDEVLEILDAVKIPSLFVKFESGRVPPGLFSRLILQFFQWCDKEWKSPVNPQLFKDFVMFHIRPDEGSSVVLLCHSSSIEIIFLSGNDDFACKADLTHGNFDVTTSRAIHWQMTMILECMRNEFFWLVNMRYEMFVCCSVCSRSVKCRHHGVRGCEECLHFLSQSDLHKLQYCNRAGIRRDCRIHVQQYVPWFSFSDEPKQRMSLMKQQAAKGCDVDVTQTDRRRIVTVEGAEDQTLAIPDHFGKSIQSEECGSKDIVSRFQESLELDSATLANPERGTKRWIRCLAIQAKSENRTDVVEYLRKITPAGTTVAEDQTLALPDDCVKSIQSEECGSKDVMSRFQESLELDSATLANPERETKRWIRCLAIQAKSENRTDVVEYLRKIAPAGTTGPLLNEDLDVRRIPFRQRKDLTFSLSGGDEWKLLAERLGLSQIDIRFLDKRTQNPCDVVLGVVGRQGHLSVGELYDILVDCELPAIADFM